MGAQAADHGAHLPSGFGPVRPGSLATVLGEHQTVLQVCSGASYPLFNVRGKGVGSQEAKAVAENSLNNC